MGKIPHGRSLEERREYAKKIKKVATSFYDERWSWTTKRVGGRLVEVWESGGTVSIHPSRNCFYRVTDRQQRSKWHTLATDPQKILMFQSGWQARTKRGIKPPEPKAHAKPLWAPPWAKEAELIGYTSEREIRLDDTPIWLAGLQSHPSVYYKHGHVTLDHATPGNIGWEQYEQYERHGKVLFFRNVPSEYL